MRSTLPMPASAVADDVVRNDLDAICRKLRPDLAILAGRRALITGGAGFLGHYLVRALAHWNESGEGQPIALTVLDNFLRGAPAWLSELHLARAVSLLQHDITQPLDQAAERWDYILHAASIASPTFYRAKPIETMDANVLGVRHLLELCRRRADQGEPVHGMLFFSSSEIYGDPDPGNVPTAEDYRGFVSCTGPRACYDESKRYGETLCVNFASQYGVPVKIVRPFNNYGPGLRLHDGRVIPDFAADILAGRDIRLLSDGSPRRTFCYVADAVAGYYQALLRGRPGEAYNIGSEQPEVSIADLAEMMCETAEAELGYAGKVVRATSSDPNYLVHNPIRRRPNIDKARRELGYEPEVGLEEGLRRSLRWYRQEQEIAA